MNLKFNLEKDKLVKMTKKLSTLWISKNQWVFFTIWILLTVVVFWVWYSLVYQYQWSENEKNDYIKEQGQGVVLQEEKYQKILENTVEKSATLEGADDIKIGDIFGL